MRGGVAACVLCRTGWCQLPVVTFARHAPFCYWADITVRFQLESILPSDLTDLYQLSTCAEAALAPCAHPFFLPFAEPHRAPLLTCSPRREQLPKR